MRQVARAWVRGAVRCPPAPTCANPATVRPSARVAAPAPAGRHVNPILPIPPIYMHYWIARLLALGSFIRITCAGVSASSAPRPDSTALPISMIVLASSCFCNCTKFREKHLGNLIVRLSVAEVGCGALGHSAQLRGGGGVVQEGSSLRCALENHIMHFDQLQRR